MKYRRAQQTAWRTIAGETVLLDLEGKRMYGLNASGATLWQAMEAATGAAELTRRLIAGRPATFGRDEVESFLVELAALGLAEKAHGAERAGRRRPSAAPEPAAELEPPAISWREEVEQIAGTCAFFPSTSPLCNQAPFS